MGTMQYFLGRKGKRERKKERIVPFGYKNESRVVIHIPYPSATAKCTQFLFVRKVRQIFMCDVKIERKLLGKILIK